MGAGAKGLLIVGAGFGLGTLALLSRSASASTPSRPATPSKPGSKAKVTTTTKPPSTRGAAAIQPLVDKYCRMFGAPASLLMALGAIESSYNPAAKNLNSVAMAKGRGGAWGLFQFLLATATAIKAANPAASKKYWPKFNGTGPSLLDAETSIAMAAFDLARLWKRFKDKPDPWYVVGLAWNQGAGGVNKFLTKGGGRLTVAVLPKGATEYYRRLRVQAGENPVVNSLIASEKSSGAFNYA
jgi:soluble lytic murein transglycosylase-like protein